MMILGGSMMGNAIAGATADSSTALRNDKQKAGNSNDKSNRRFLRQAQEGSSTPSLRCNDVAQDDSFNLFAARVVTNFIAAAILLRGLVAATASCDQALTGWVQNLQ